MIKKYESFLKDIFKGPLTEYLEDYIRIDLGYTELMIEIEKGNIKKVKEIIDGGYVNLNSLVDETKENALNIAVLSDISFTKKIKIIKLLIDAGINYLYDRNNIYFYDLASKKLKKWIEKEYPDIVEKINIIKKEKEYNL